MQAILSYDQSPPLAAPFRFFMTAPVFGVLAGVLILWSGPDIFVSRWVPATLALTHLMSAGFMLQVMLGAMIQILPVVAGANMASPLRLAGAVHASLTLGALFLAFAFLSFSPDWFKVAALFFAVGIASFVISALLAFRGVPSTSATVGGLKLALVGLSLTVLFGVGLAAALGWSFNLPLIQLTDIHLTWGFVGWGAVLLASVAYVVVPMFQLTPAYPGGVERWFAPVALGLTSGWSLAYFFDASLFAALLAVTLMTTVVAFAVVTLRLQRRSKRQNFDASQQGWRVAMGCAVAAAALWLAALILPAIDNWQGWPVLCGVLILFGVFGSVIIGMLYKIVPFLVWLHLQNEGRVKGTGKEKGHVLAPNMKKIIVEIQMGRQMRAHFLSCVLLVLAVFWPDWLAYPAGLALVIAHAWLLLNLLSAVRVRRSHLQKIAAARVASAAK